MSHTIIVLIFVYAGIYLYFCINFDIFYQKNDKQIIKTLTKIKTSYSYSPELRPKVVKTPNEQQIKTNFEISDFFLEKAREIVGGS